MKTKAAPFKNNFRQNQAFTNQNTTISDNGKVQSFSKIDRLTDLDCEN